MGDGCRLQLLIFLGVMGLVGLYLYKSYLQLRGENPLLSTVDPMATTGFYSEH